jgi:hypothetical protein
VHDEAVALVGQQGGVRVGREPQVRERGDAEGRELGGHPLGQPLGAVHAVLQQERDAVADGPGDALQDRFGDEFLQRGAAQDVLELVQVPARPLLRRHQRRDDRARARARDAREPVSLVVQPEYRPEQGDAPHAAALEHEIHVLVVRPVLAHQPVSLRFRSCWPARASTAAPGRRRRR